MRKASLWTLALGLVLAVVVFAFAHEPVKQCQGAEPTRIKDIRDNPDEFVGKWVLIKGQYEGWDFNHRLNEGPPVTRSDWVIYDGTGAIYISSHRACKCVKKSIPMIEQVGQKLIVCAKVARNDRGQVYLEYVEGSWMTIEQESQPKPKPKPQSESPQPKAQEKGR